MLENDSPEPLKVDPLDPTEQVKLGERLQAGLLQTYLRRLQNGTISDTGLAALQRLLMANGWSLDPAKIPTELKDLLTQQVDPETEFDDDAVVGRIA